MTKIHQNLRNNLIKWYIDNHRKLPWRETTNPYKIWLSEIILQQTRVSQGLPYYNNFVTQYPSVRVLAGAPLDEVLRLWQGLGYYSRARNLHACAQQIMNEYSGSFPNTYKELLRLKGIGKYTAAAIASFAFNEVVPAVDGNAFRVFSRLLGIKHDIAQAKTFKVFFEEIKNWIDPRDPATFNQAVMELGATICSPKKPKCLICPLQSMCYAFEKNEIDQLPVKIKKLKIKNRFLHYFLLEYKDQFYWRQRTEKGIWNSLYEPFCLETNSIQETHSLIEHDLTPVLMQFHPKKQDKYPNVRFNPEIVSSSTPIKHILTHQKLTLKFIHLKLSKEFVTTTGFDAFLKEFALQSFSKDEVEQIPKPIALADYFENYILKDHLF